jgi:hypothetical protein
MAAMNVDPRFLTEEGPEIFTGSELVIEALADVVGQESQHGVPVLLQQGVLAAVAAVGLNVPQVLHPVQLDGHPGPRAEQVHLHFALPVKRNRQRNIQPEPAGRFRQRFQAAVQKRLRSASRSIRPLRVGGHRPGRPDEQVSQRRNPSNWNRLWEPEIVAFFA